MKINLILILLSCFLHLCASNLNPQIQEQEIEKALEKAYGNNLLGALKFVANNNPEISYSLKSYTVNDVKKWLQDKYTETQKKYEFFSQMFINEPSTRAQELSDNEFELLQQITTNQDLYSFIINGKAVKLTSKSVAEMLNRIYSENNFRSLQTNGNVSRLLSQEVINNLSNPTLLGILQEFSLKQYPNTNIPYLNDKTYTQLVQKIETSFKLNDLETKNLTLFDRFLNLFSTGRSKIADRINRISNRLLKKLKAEKDTGKIKEIIEQLLNFGRGQDLIKALTPDQIKALTPDQMKALKPDQIKALTPDQIKALTPDQIKALTPDQIGSLTENSFKALVLKLYSLDLREMYNLSGDQKAGNQTIKTQELIWRVLQKLPEKTIKLLDKEDISYIMDLASMGYNPNQIEAIFFNSYSDIDRPQAREVLKTIINSDKLYTNTEIDKINYIQENESPVFEG